MKNIFFKFSTVYRNGQGSVKWPSRAFSGATLQNKIDNRTAETINKYYILATIAEQNPTNSNNTHTRTNGKSSSNLIYMTYTYRKLLNEKFQ